jgi:hypothetical protein
MIRNIILPSVTPRGKPTRFGENRRNGQLFALLADMRKTESKLRVSLTAFRAYYPNHPSIFL